ncbi:GNAT family N-acetyltransferase [Leptolyngbya sp. NIES-2104]|uniref:GNAT family N-acetyltransferase n=1 Tax=Leptolyngbya sp. NIES-2104 TaxID=1552121 RepID=UPI0006EC54C1|nr:GNAT family N-acetyltransferase [Leptolyngbya sp. NIES-2104]GAP98705.1 phosphinothricin N-acetyltransferase [Leptolyngbya sp. NIES-2104]
MIRNAVESDLPAIVEIYNHAVATKTITADVEPVTVESRLAWFHSHSSRYPLWVLEQESMIAGWFGLRMFYGREAYRSTAEISLYVSPHFQRQGVGQTLLTHAIAQCPTLEIHTLLAIAFAENLPSVALLKKFGFEQWGYLPQVARSWECDRDVIILGRKI